VAAATARYLQLLAEVLVRGLWADHGARTPAHWLSHEIGVGASTAADHVRVALRLRELPLIRSRFASGTLSYTKVRAITRVAVPELEPMLIEWCASATGAEVERIVRAFRRTARRPTLPDATTDLAPPVERGWDLDVDHQGSGRRHRRARGRLRSDRGPRGG
jgi:hypothetical protein